MRGHGSSEGSRGGSNERPRDPEDKGRELAELVDPFRFGMLVNVSSDGELRARPMTILEKQGATSRSDEAHGATRLTFSTSLDNALVDDLKDTPRVCVTLQDGYKYVSLTCSARLEQDRERIRGLWSPQLEAWFPNGPDSPEIVLIDCDVTFAEFWDVSGFERVRYAIEAGRAYLSDDRMNPRNAGRHAELQGGELRQ
jgi:general stress protein 26